MSTRALIEQILESNRFAVAGASQDPEKFGHKVYQTLKAAGYTVFPINPNAETVAGDTAYPALDNVPGGVDCVVTVTTPDVTEMVIHAAGHLHVPYLWMQPGSESNAAFNLARGFSMQIISGGPCIMNAVRDRELRRAGLG